MSDTRSGYRLMMVLGLLGIAGAVAACVDDDSERHRTATTTERTTTSVSLGSARNGLYSTCWSRTCASAPEYVRISNSLNCSTICF